VALLWSPLSVYLRPLATLDIEDATRQSEATLHAPPGYDAIYALDVVGSGRITGEGEISLILNGAPYKTHHVSGEVSFTWGGDWYSPEAKVRFTPSSKASGSVTLHYKFRSL